MISLSDGDVTEEVATIHDPDVHEEDGMIDAEEIEALLLSMECPAVEDDCITDSSDDIILSLPPDFICKDSDYKDGDSPNSTLISDPVDQSLSDGNASMSATMGDVNNTASGSFSVVEYGPTDELSVVVSSVITPSCFYAVPSDNAQSLESLEMSLKAHYSNPQNCHVLTEGHIRVGAVCCTESMTAEGLCYSRGIIQSLHSNVTDRIILNNVDSPHPVATNDTDDPITTNSSSLTARVFCVDYGFIATVDLNSLFVLEDSFAALPVQCIACSLSGVDCSDTAHCKPEDMTDSTESKINNELPLVVNKTNCWSTEEIQYFDRIVQNKLLMGVVTDKTGELIVFVNKIITLNI